MGSTKPADPKTIHTEAMRNRMTDDSNYVHEECRISQEIAF